MRRKKGLVESWQIVSDFESLRAVSDSELDQVRSYAETVFNHPDVSSPPAFTLDVGIIRDRGWAVIECKECWASGIYACDDGGAGDKGANDEGANGTNGDGAKKEPSKSDDN